MVKAWTGSGQSLAVRQRAFASVGPRKTPPHTGVKRRGWSRSERSPRERVERHVGFDLVCNGSTLNGSAPLFNQGSSFCPFSPSALARTRTSRPFWRRFRRAARGSGKATPDGDAERIILTCPRPSRRTCQPISGLSGCD
jgi:hypothetical protein